MSPSVTWPARYTLTVQKRLPGVSLAGGCVRGTGSGEGRQWPAVAGIEDSDGAEDDDGPVWSAGTGIVKMV